MPSHNAIEDEIERIYGHPRELAGIVAEIGATPRSEGAQQALAQAVAEIASGNTALLMRGCDETPVQCIQRIVHQAAAAEARYNLGVANSEDFADYEGRRAA